MNDPCFLLVDDLEENLLSLEALLRRDGLKILKARSGDEALELLLHHEVALALIDVQMPGLNGFELAELMRGNERTRHVPIIFVTAGTADGQRRFRGYEAGAVDFIQKPIEPDIIRSKAGVFFELYRQRQQIIAQRDELAAHADALKAADQRKDDFLAILAHELRNPLAPLRLGLDLLKRDPNSTNAADIRDTMDRQLGHLVRLIDDLMDVARVRQGKIELRKKLVKVESVISAAVESSQPAIETAGHTLAVDLPPQALWLDADLTRLAQVVANLLNNAVKYTPSGGRIDLKVRADDSELVIVVADSGIGIPLEMQSKIFELFTQAPNHAERSQGGLGLGLAIVKRLVDMHGGAVSASSGGEGQGSEFMVRIPLAAAPPAYETEIAANHTASRPAAGGLKILIVDDNEDVARTLGWMLEEMGHLYEAVHDGRVAVESAKRFRPDVVLLDIGLPGMDGYEVCKALRQQTEFLPTAIIAQSGWGQAHDKALSAQAGFDDHLTKPVPFEQLERLLASLRRQESH